MILIDEKTGNCITILDDALDLMLDHRLRMPKPKEIQAYTPGSDGKKIPNIKHSICIAHIHKECFFQMLEQLKQDMSATFQKYSDGTQNINTFQCGAAKIKRSVHIGFWKLLTEFSTKNHKFTVEDLSHMDLKDSDQFDITVLEAEIKPRMQQPITPAQYSPAQLERNNTRK